MKFLHAILAGILCAASLALPGAAFAGPDPSATPVERPVAAALVDEAAAPVARSGTEAEMQRYALREAASPQVQDYAGGEVIVVIGFFGAVILFFCCLVVVVAD